MCIWDTILGQLVSNSAFALVSCFSGVLRSAKNAPKSRTKAICIRRNMSESLYVFRVPGVCPHCSLLTQAARQSVVNAFGGSFRDKPVLGQEAVKLAFQATTKKAKGKQTDRQTDKQYQ